MLHVILQWMEWLLWIAMAPSALYILVFALGSLKRRKTSSVSVGAASDEVNPRFLVLFPAYGEDRVICRSVEAFLRQDYPADNYRVAVISDHQTEATNKQLAQLPITLHQPVFDRSSKARAMQYALAKVGESDYDYVVVLDADNVVLPTFLQQLSAAVARYQAEMADGAGRVAIQCHRTAKNADSDIAMLDGVSEEINNSIFRRGHNRLGLSSALIGSGMCFSFKWFRENAPRYFELATVPLEEIPPALEKQLANYPDFHRRGTTYYWEYEGHGIWGLTSRILTTLSHEHEED